MFHIIHCREQRKIRCFEWPSSGFWTAALPIEPVVAGKGPRQGATFVPAKPFLGGGGGGGAPSKNVLNFRYFRWYLLTVFCIILRILCARIQLSSTVCLTPLQNILLTKHSPPPPSGATLALTTAIGSESYSHMTYKELCNSVRQNHHNSRLLCHKPTTLEYISH